MRKDINLDDFPPEYDGKKLRGWHSGHLSIDLKDSPAMLNVERDEEMYESRTYNRIGVDDWCLKILSKRKKGADELTVLIKMKNTVANTKQILIGEYRDMVSEVEMKLGFALDVEHVVVAVTEDFEMLNKALD